MDLVPALAIMNTPAFVPGRSNAKLAAAVQQELNEIVSDAATSGKVLHSKPVVPAFSIDGIALVRPIDAMLELARATRPLVSDDVYSWYRHWSWLRYLGIFDRHADGQLALSSAGLKVRANQRRVMSEELGVGFGALLAKCWCGSLGAGGPITTVDVDLLLREGHLWKELKGISATADKRQPDYLLIFPRSGNPRAFSYKALECKGSSSGGNVNQQLARAVTQLSSLELNRRTPQGVAVCTVSGPQGVHYLAVDPDEEDGVDTVELTNNDLARAREPSAITRTPTGTLELAAGETVARSLLLGAGTLADYAGNNEAAAMFLPPPTQRRLGRRPGTRVTRENAYGVFRGVEYQFPTPGGSILRAFMGVSNAVDNGLSSGNLDEVSAVQRNFSARRHEIPQDYADGVSAISDDGAILILDTSELPR